MTWFVPDFSNRYPTGADLRDLRQHSRQTPADLAALCGVTPRTWSRWEAAPRVPLAPYRLVMTCMGWVPDPAWAGWGVGQGRLWSPADDSFTPGDLQSLPYLRAIISELRQKLRPPGPPPWYGDGI
jgi:hypothetical protein